MREVDNPIERYLFQHCTIPDQLLAELERETYLKTLAPQMLSGRRLGQFLSHVSMMVQPMTILEIGTFTGYGTLSLAPGLQQGGELHTIESNPELDHISSKYFNRSAYASQIHQHKGDALDILPLENISWDLVFIDGAKKQYLQYYEMVIDKLRPGGIILADNVLWGGKVIFDDDSDETETLKQFNAMVQQDDRVTNIMLELRDGLLVCRKK